MPDNREPYETPAIVDSGNIKSQTDTGNIKFTKIEGYNLELGNAAPGSRNRLMIFRSQPYDLMEHVTDTNILIIGKTAKTELHRMMTDHGRPTIEELLPEGVSSKTYTKLRKYFGLAK